DMMRVDCRRNTQLSCMAHGNWSGGDMARHSLWGEDDPVRLGRLVDDPAENAFFIMLVGKGYVLALNLAGQERVVVPKLVAPLVAKQLSAPLPTKTFHFRVQSISKGRPRDWAKLARHPDRYLLPVTADERHAANQIAVHDRATGGFRILRRWDGSPQAARVRARMGVNAGADLRGLLPVPIFPNDQAGRTLASAIGAIRTDRGQWLVPGQYLQHLTPQSRKAVAELASGNARQLYLKARDEPPPHRAYHHALYIQRGRGAQDDIEADSNGPLLLSNLGSTPMERAQFFAWTERIERKGGRVAHKIVAALPYDLPVEDCREIARQFVEPFDCMNLGYLAVVHRPPRGGKNRHVHIMLYDRPIKRDGDGWRATGGKISEIHDRSWPKQQRVRWAALCRARQKLAYQSRSAGGEIGDLVLFDARTNRERGDPSTPTLHLGSAAAELERQGIPTAAGLRNALLRLNDHMREIDAGRLTAHANANSEADASPGSGTVAEARDQVRAAGKVLADAIAWREAIHLGIEAVEAGSRRRIAAISRAASTPNQMREPGTRVLAEAAEALEYIDHSADRRRADAAVEVARADLEQARARLLHSSRRAQTGVHTAQPATDADDILCLFTPDEINKIMECVKADSIRSANQGACRPNVHPHPPAQMDQPTRVPSSPKISHPSSPSVLPRPEPVVNDTVEAIAFEPDRTKLARLLRDITDAELLGVIKHTATISKGSPENTVLGSRARQANQLAWLVARRRGLMQEPNTPSPLRKMDPQSR
ncbi:MAG: MobA/MobL family protein, partial [Actinomycetota bacterium]